MEKGEEEIKVIHRITNSSSAHGNNKCDDDGVFCDHAYIPIDLTREIIMRLPAKSIVKFRCVSKLWWSITTQPDFINSFTIRQSSARRQSLLLSFSKEGNGKKQVFCMLPFHENSTSYSDVNNFYIMPPTKDCRYESDNVSVNGLITFRNATEILIWNPTMKEHITLLKPKTPKRVGSLLVYDPTENTYKILSMAFSYRRWEEYQNPQILTLGSQEPWRVIKNSPDHNPRSECYCINGVVYYRADISFKEDRDDQSIVPQLPKEILAMKLKDIVMSFDVRSEQFKSIQLPGRAHQYESKLYETLMSYRGKLAWVCYNSNIIKIWVWHDGEKQEWSETEFVLPLHIRDLLGSARLKVATSAGEFIYVSGKLVKDISAFYYDPVRETITSVKGLDYENFRRCYRSSSYHRISSSLQLYPDHIESLVSLKTLCVHPLCDDFCHL